MRKLLVIVIAALYFVPAYSQNPAPKEKKKFNLGNRAGDHFMVQISRDSWSGAPDSITSHIKGFSKGANVYLMLDKPFKGNPRFSAAIGIGVGTSNIGFKKMIVDIGATTSKLPFRNVDTLSSYKKFKVTTAYLEIPVELRFTANPDMPGKTLKFAIGAKIGTLLNAHTKAKELRDASGRTINTYTSKLTTKGYFNTSRIAATARIGYGYFSLFGAYGITGIFKDGVAADTKLLQIGLTISGL